MAPLKKLLDAEAEAAAAAAAVTASSGSSSNSMSRSVRIHRENSRVFRVRDSGVLTVVSFRQA